MRSLNQLTTKVLLSMLMLVNTSVFSTTTQIEEAQHKDQLIPTATRQSHSVTIGEQSLNFDAIWTPMVLKNAQDESIGTIAGTSYVVKDVGNTPRPVIFFFNGGPGSSSSPMHSALNPVLQKQFETHLLTDADLVFVDPVGTGYSRNLGNTTPFWSMEGDAEAAQLFIKHWLHTQNRESSQFFVAGASYGSFRLAMMMPELSKIGVAGAIFISPAIDFSGTSEDSTNNRIFITQLPTMAIAAWHHGVANSQFSTVQEVYQYARAFAENEYAQVLQAGTLAAEADIAKVAARMSALINISPDLLREHNLRLPKQVFLENAVPGVLLGRLDTRITRPAEQKPANSDRPAAANDPALGLGKSNKIISSYWKQYLADNVGVETELDYYSLNLDLNFAWDWRAVEKTPRFVVNPLERVQQAMKDDQRFSVMVIGGLFDLTTPVADSEYLFTRTGFDPNRVDFSFSQVAHAPFEDTEHRNALVNQVRDYIAKRMAADSHYAVIQNGEKVGYLDLYQRQRNTVDITYFVNQNGRGAKLRSLIAMNEDGYPLDWTIRGSSMMGGSVTEHYEFADGMASWQSQADAGKTNTEKPLLYATNDSTPWELGLYARRLLAAKDHRLDVLPSGFMQLETLKSLTVRDTQNRNPLNLTIYKISGLNRDANFIMLDDEQKLFAVYQSYKSLVLRNGYQHLLTELSDHFEAARKQNIKDMQQGLAHIPNQPVHITNVRVLDVEKGALTEPSVVVVEGEKIAMIKPFTNYSRPENVTVIEGNGGTLVPGLYDMHAHTSEISGMYYLAAGVTGTRDMGNQNSWLLSHFAQQKLGEVVGPHIYPLGLIEGRSPYNAETGVVADTLQEALDAVEWYHDNGYPGIKLYNSVHPDWVKPIVTYAKKYDMKVAGHVPAFVSPDEAIVWGYDDIAHLNQLVLGWLLQEGEDTRTTVRLTAMQRTHELDLTSEKVQRSIDLMRKHNVAQETTLVILERLMASRAGKVPPGDVDYLSHMPIGYQRYRKRTFVRLPDEKTDKAYIDSVASLLDITKLLHDNGITILPGTDAQDGFTLHREIELYTLAGIPNAEALRLATLGSAEYLGWGDVTGSIAKGKRADFFLISGNPLTDIKTIKKPIVVLKSGQIYWPHEIYQKLGIAPFN